MRYLLVFLLTITQLWAQSLETKLKANQYLLVAKRAYEIKNIKNPPMDCDRIYDLNKSIWESKVNNDNVVVAGKLEIGNGESLSLENIEELKIKKMFAHPELKLLPKKKFQGKKISYISHRKFLHSPPGYMQRSECIDFTNKKFEKTTKLIERLGKVCREVKFQNPKKPEQVYYQTLCAGDNNVYLSYHPENEFGKLERNVGCEK